MHVRQLVLVTAAVLLALFISAGAMATRAATPKLHGTIGPGYTISLKNAQGKRVTTLTHGTYTFVIRDEASIHNFTLNGPGISNKVLTGTTFVGTKTVTVALKTGKYRFYCTVHPTITGTFKVT